MRQEASKIQYNFKRDQIDDSSTAVQVNIEDVIEALRCNREFLINFFIHDIITVSVPTFHVEIADYILHVEIPRFALAVPRGFSKTTIVKICVIWYFLFSDFRFIVYCSNTTTVARDEVRDII